ncbi:Uncharacterised protein [Salmonella enterica subsp. enterica serovar Bovismorbificans]|uniref:Uncharacterized protein n=1 Tax=Salmonella enterica subsp. enterica serovar Bovismorbificans TaxID=58097 RepID=A0A655BLE3_SALET|nr:Uncharacterised protein [Salmonella enterica subsp. enterica serovar Bovismorbificans]
MLNRTGVVLISVATPAYARNINIASPINTPHAARYPPLTPRPTLFLSTKSVFGPGTRTIKIAPTRYVQ